MKDRSKQIKMTDYLIEQGVFLGRLRPDFPDTNSGTEKAGYAGVDKALQQGAADHLWTKDDADDFLREIDRTWQ